MANPGVHGCPFHLIFLVLFFDWGYTVTSGRDFNDGRIKFLFVDHNLVAI